MTTAANGETSCSELLTWHNSFVLIALQVLVAFVSATSSILVSLFLYLLLRKKVHYPYCRGVLYSIVLCIACWSSLTLARALKLLLFAASATPTASWCRWFEDSGYCLVEGEGRVCLLCVAFCSFIGLFVEKTQYALTFRNNECDRWKWFAWGYTLLPWLIVGAYFAAAFCLAGLHSPSKPAHSSCFTDLTGSLMYQMLSNVVLPGSVIALVVAVVVVHINKRRSANGIITFDGKEKTVTSSFYWERNLKTMVRMIVGGCIAVVFLCLSLFALQSHRFTDVDEHSLLWTKEVPNVLFGSYGAILVIILSLASKISYRRRLRQLWPRIPKSSVANNTTIVCGPIMHNEGREYFDYYRKSWKSGKRSTFIDRLYQKTE